MTDFNVLILDDEEPWLAQHERRLTQAGFSCRATQDAKDAIKIARTDPTIKFALIDEILYVPPVPPVESDRELQRWQGSGVIREIIAQRLDIQIIVVSAAPQIESSGDNRKFRQETSKLRRQKGVIDIIHKIDIQEDPEAAYNWLTKLLHQPQAIVKAEVITPRILVGWGFTRDTYEAMSEQIGMRQKFLPLTSFVKKLDSDRIIEEFHRRAEEKTIFYEMPGSKKFDPLRDIKPNSSAFQILEFLACQAEKESDVQIREQDYKCESRQSRKPADAFSDYDPRSVKDFAYSYNDDGIKRLQVQIEKAPNPNSRLKVAIHRLSQHLGELNVGPARQLFRYEDGSYSPSFKLGIVLYAIKAQKG